MSRVGSIWDLIPARSGRLKGPDPRVARPHVVIVRERDVALRTQQELYARTQPIVDFGADVDRGIGIRARTVGVVHQDVHVGRVGRGVYQPALSPRPRGRCCRRRRCRRRSARPGEEESEKLQPHECTFGLGTRFSDYLAAKTQVAENDPHDVVTPITPQLMPPTTSNTAGGSLIRQTALFDPVAVRGLLYWYGLWGTHQMVFAGMLRNIVRAAAPASHASPRSSFATASAHPADCRS